jgi:hypothetical protein
VQTDSSGHEDRTLHSSRYTVLCTDKEKQAELVLQEALSKLDGCTALAAAEAEAPVVVIENLTQEAVQRIDRAAGDVAACLAGTGTIMCVFDVVSHNLHIC